MARAKATLKAMLPITPRMTPPIVCAVAGRRKISAAIPQGVWVFRPNTCSSRVRPSTTTAPARPARSETGATSRMRSPLPFSLAFRAGQ